jgi:cystathionine beta-lyase
MAICAGPEDVFLALRGMRTMALRLKEHERQALDMAQWLVGRPEVHTVLHPALESHPGHAIWKRDFSGSSGLFSVILQPASQKSTGTSRHQSEDSGLYYSLKPANYMEVGRISHSLNESMESPWRR